MRVCTTPLRTQCSPATSHLPLHTHFHHWCYRQPRHCITRRFQTASMTGRWLGGAVTRPCVGSKDDFYATPTLVVMETTNGIYDRSLYNPETIKPQTALSWQRAAIATGFGLNGSDWVNLFKRHNSGTYNNQWMVLDTAHFVPGGELPSAGLLYVAEQIPGSQKNVASSTFP